MPFPDDWRAQRTKSTPLAMKLEFALLAAGGTLIGLQLSWALIGQALAAMRWIIKLWR